MKLRGFLSKTRGLIDLIEESNQELGQKIHAAWFDMEQACAVCLARNQPLETYQDDLYQALIKIQNLVSNELCRLKDKGDDA